MSLADSIGKLRQAIDCAVNASALARSIRRATMGRSARCAAIGASKRHHLRSGGAGGLDRRGKVAGV